MEFEIIKTKKADKIFLSVEPLDKTLVSVYPNGEGEFSFQFQPLNVRRPKHDSPLIALCLHGEYLFSKFMTV